MIGLRAFGAVPGGSTKRAEKLPGDDTQERALASVRGLGLPGLGLGAGVRGLQGLRDMTAKPLVRRKPAIRPAVVEVRVPTVDDDQPAPEPVTRRAGLKFGGVDDGSPAGPLDVVLDAVSRNTNAPQFKRPDTSDLLLGRHSPSSLGKPWYLPAAFAVGGAGLYGGYRAIDRVLGARHKQEKADELEEAKRDYRNALVEQYSPESIKTGAARDTLGGDLSELYGLCKRAVYGAETAGTGLGAYLALAGMLAGGTGLAAYNYAKSRSPDERLAKAIQQRERLRWATRPPEIYAIAKPAPATVRGPVDEYKPATEADRDLVSKYSAAVASLYQPQ